MVKIYQDGWEYSKRQVLEYKESEAGRLDELKAKAAWNEPEFTDGPEDFYRCVEMFCQKAAETLEAQGIPGAPLVYKCKNSGRWKPAWAMPDRNRMPRRSELRTITDHVKALEYDRDTREDLAARILLRAYGLEQANSKDEAAYQAFCFGFDVAMGKVYDCYTTKKSRGGSNSRRLSTVWAPILAEHMVQQNKKIRAGQVYDRLAGLEGEGATLTIDGWTFTADTEGDIQAENQDGQIDTLATSSFEKYYLTPLRK
jgi:hypothetical protein